MVARDFSDHGMCFTTDSAGPCIANFQKGGYMDVESVCMHT